jgi:hypothetical protein
VEHDPGDRFDVCLLDPARDLDVAKPVEGEARLEHLAFRRTPQRVDVRLPGTPQDFGIELSSLIENLCVADRDCRPRLAAHPDPQPAHHVLAEIVETPLPRVDVVF